MESDFTPTEAAAVTGLSIKAVNKAIENRLVPAKRQSAGGVSKRFLNYGGLVCLQLEARGMNVLPLQVRRHIFKQVLRSPRQALIQESEVFLIDVKAARKRLALSLSDLERARKMVISDPGILQGVPVIRDTRIPVHLIADMLDSGARTQEILEGYPSLTDESIRLAQLYARAFPKRGRPRKKAPRRGVVRTRRRLSAVA